MGDSLRARNGHDSLKTELSSIPESLITSQASQLKHRWQSFHGEEVPCVGAPIFSN